MARVSESIRKAIDAIGESNSDEDWKIEPTQHAELFRSQAPSLADVLLDTRPMGLAEQYEALNTGAVEFQRFIGVQEKIHDQRHPLRERPPSLESGEWSFPIEGSDHGRKKGCPSLAPRNLATDFREVGNRERQRVGA